MKNIDYDNLFPTIPEEISKKIEAVVEENVNGTASAKTIPFAKKKKPAAIKWVAAAAAICLLVPTGVYAAGKAYSAYVVQKSKYEVGINISLGETQTSTADVTEHDTKGSNALEEQISIAEQSGAIIGFKDLKLNYIPDDFQYQTDGPYEGKYTSTLDMEKRGLTPVFYKAPAGQVEISEKYTLERESWETKSGNTAIHLIKDRGWNQLWITFPDTPYFALFYINGFTEEEVKLLADGAQLIDSDVECALDYQEKVPVSGGATIPEIRMDSGKLMDIGDSYIREDAEFTLKSISVQENFDGITTDSIGRPADYSEYVSSDGKVRFTHTYKKLGDGISQLDEIVSCKEVEAKIVLVEFEVQNVSDKTTECNISPELVVNKFGVAKSVDEAETGYQHIRSFSYGMFGFETQHETSKNNLINLKPQEKAIVRVCFAVDEDAFDSTYIIVAENHWGENAFISLNGLNK